MNTINSSSHLKKWLKLSRLIPLLTILGAGGTNVLLLFGVIKLSLPEGIIISLLGFLAIDALIERVSILERIDTKFRAISTAQTLKRRVEISPVEEQARNTSEIYIIAIAGTSLIINNSNFFASKMKDGCKIKAILLNPDRPSLQVWEQQSKMPRTEYYIGTALETLKRLVQMNNCEVRLLDVFLPFSMFAVDLQKASGSMIIEYHIYQDTPEERPHIFLTSLDNQYWFNFYRQQFERAWLDATIWSPSATS